MPKAGTTWLKALAFAIVNRQHFSSFENNNNHSLLTFNSLELVPYVEFNLERPHKVLFLKYEDLKEDVNFHTKRIAEFVGFPFTQEEENNGVIGNIIIAVNVNREFFFRKGEIGDQ
ncbi:putative quercetin-3-sulfate 4'-sulfotransferase [Medicago truncatula]|nr:putative quercetin-3-sulfate 4'-sulfotransferase [Medicago truncatula]